MLMSFSAIKIKYSLKVQNDQESMSEFDTEPAEFKLKNH